MKNIWKILIASIAIVSTIVLAGCPDADTKKTDDPPVAAGIPAVYSLDVTTDAIASSWGGSPSAPSFTIIFLTDKQKSELDTVYAEADEWIKSADVSDPIYQLAADGNATFVSNFTGSYAVKGATGKKYTGVAVTNADRNLGKDASGDDIIKQFSTVYVDTTKVVKTDLKILAADAEAIATAEDKVDLSAFRPYILSLISGLDVKGNGPVGEGWSGQLFAMYKEGSMPTTKEDPLKEDITIEITLKDASVLTITNVKAFVTKITSVNGSPFGWDGGSAQEFVVDAAGKTYKVDANGNNTAPWITTDGDKAFGGMPAGCDAYVKLAIGGEEGFLAFKAGAASTHDWADRK